MIDITKHLYNKILNLGFGNISIITRIMIDTAQLSKGGMCQHGGGYVCSTINPFWIAVEEGYM